MHFEDFGLKLRVLFTLLFLITVAACNGLKASNSSSSSSAPTYADIEGAGGSLRTIQAGTVATQFNSTPAILTASDAWQSPCTELVAGVSYSRSKLVVENDQAYSFEIFHSDSNCQTPIWQIYSLSTLTTLGTSPTNSNATAVNSTLQWIRAAPLTSAGATEMNSASGGFCGFTDWTAETAKDITGLSCVNGKASGSVEYTIFRTEIVTLSFGISGSGKDGASSENRFTDLATSPSSDFYIRQ